MSWQTAVCIAFFYVLLLLSFIDIDTMRLPNQLVGLLAIIGAGSLAITQFTDVTAAPLLMPLGQGLLSIPVVYALFGALISAGSVLLIALVYSRVRGAEGFGMGDIKLLAVMGPFLGPYTLLVLLLGSVFGAVYGVVASREHAEGMRHKFPFGPFLALAAVVVTLVGEPFVACSTSTLRRSCGPSTHFALEWRTCAQSPWGHSKRTQYIGCWAGAFMRRISWLLVARWTDSPLRSRRPSLCRGVSHSED